MRKCNFDYIPLCLFVVSLFSLIQCKKDTESVDNDVVRPIIQLTTSDITTFNGMTQVKFGETPWSVDEIISGIYTPIYEYRWDSDGDDFAYIDIWVADSKNLAFDILEEKQKFYTIPPNLLEQSKDIPAIVGDLSYHKGLEFIRDNFIVRIHTSESFNNSISEIAKCVDSKILKRPTYNLATQVKPVIKTFKLNKNPVSVNTKTALTIQVDDPNNKAIIYKWRFDKSSGYGEITVDDSGIYYYNSSWVDSINISIGLTLIATNELGFCSDSTIYIQTIKE